MFEKYTEKARRVIFFARHEVGELGAAPQISIDHLFLGLLRVHEELISPLLPEGSAVDAIRNEIRQHAKGYARILPRILRLPLYVDVPLSADAIKALEYAAEESITLGQGHVSTEHLLLGLMRIKNSFIEKLLRQRAVARSELYPQQVAWGRSALRRMLRSQRYAGAERKQRRPEASRRRCRRRPKTEPRLSPSR